MKEKLVLLGLSFLLLQCGVPAESGPTQALVLEEIPLVSIRGMAPNMHVSEDGQVFLSWVEFLNDSVDALHYSTLTDTGWTFPNRVASGSDWFANWADFPSVVPFSGLSPNLAAHWLQKSAGGTYDYDVRISVADKTGEDWSDTFLPHTDGIAAEHGFVSMVPTGPDRMLACWLDGRNTKTEIDPAMSLRVAEFDLAGQLSNEMEIDARTCDCCQTDLAMTNDGPIVVYRDRSDEEVRDISIVRQLKGVWQPPVCLYPDNWVISGCPVNGPAVATTGDDVAVGWFTAADDNPQVLVMLSSNNAADFTDPIRVDIGRPIGRVDVLWFTEELLAVVWMEGKNTVGEIHLALLNKAGKIVAHQVLLRTSSTRSSGFPILAKWEDSLILATTLVGESTYVRTYRIAVNYNLILE